MAAAWLKSLTVYPGKYKIVSTGFACALRALDLILTLWLCCMHGLQLPEVMEFCLSSAFFGQMEKVSRS